MVPGRDKVTVWRPIRCYRRSRTNCSSFELTSINAISVRAIWILCGQRIHRKRDWSKRSTSLKISTRFKEYESSAKDKFDNKSPEKIDINNEMRSNLQSFQATTITSLCQLKRKGQSFSELHKKTYFCSQKCHYYYFFNLVFISHWQILFTRFILRSRETNPRGTWILRVIKGVIFYKQWKNWDNR